ncbi:hypothetical protein TRFO_29250 [Tritrichomonas foetus]|uniref:Uncharacterized protein n=1 Tax=Tritrichomonas foetus TaxID=1144522 RepID=A0A1J4K0W0_9EUKA|nr:hypothetical protein TRFO_29250 [Tritrichomonas foetus]|eukprot:OHT03380.1 hypothetical protein TRFO_29250 [Tritrichomonas foetus]
MNDTNNLIIDLEDLTPPKELWKEFSVQPSPKTISMSLNKKLAQFPYHSLLFGFCHAYKEHRPITISPDIIWILIVQGFSQHVNFNAEQLRNKFVNFSDKKELKVKREHLTLNTITPSDWENIFEEFPQQISEYTGKDLINNLTPNFTTTTKVSFTVGSISIMSAMQQYFSYTAMLGGCGLPFIQVEGTVDDWQKIMSKVQFLEQYELEWWTKELKPIINEIIRSKSGQINKSFWLRMIKYKEGNLYRNYEIDGWICAFFPYNKIGEQQNLTHIEFRDFDLLPEGILEVPMKLQIFDSNGILISEDPCIIKAGFYGLSQDPKTFCVKPEFGWVLKFKEKEMAKALEEEYYHYLA